jgi:hypothetical protein
MSTNSTIQPTCSFFVHLYMGNCMMLMRHIKINMFVTIVFIGLTIFARSSGQTNEMRKVLGPIQNPLITEASGLAASRQNENVLWVHNDSGDQNRIFALNSTGKHLGIFFIKGAKAIDWEDLAIGPGPLDEYDYLFIGDIGDNNVDRQIKQIYRVVEPEIDANRFPKDSTLTKTEIINFSYPDKNYDAEALMVDPITKDIYVITKCSNNARLYRLAFPQQIKKLNKAEFIGELKMTDVTAADISASGGEILVKTYNDVYYWTRFPGRSLSDVLLNDVPKRLPYVPESQGESIAWHPNSLGYYTTSEEKGGVEAQLIFYKF